MALVWLQRLCMSQNSARVCYTKNVRNKIAGPDASNPRIHHQQSNQSWYNHTELKLTALFSLCVLEMQNPFWWCWSVVLWKSVHLKVQSYYTIIYGKFWPEISQANLQSWIKKIKKKFRHHFQDFEGKRWHIFDLKEAAVIDSHIIMCTEKHWSFERKQLLTPTWFERRGCILSTSSKPKNSF